MKQECKRKGGEFGRWGAVRGGKVDSRLGPYLKSQRTIMRSKKIYGSTVRIRLTGKKTVGGEVGEERTHWSARNLCRDGRFSKERRRVTARQS